jgi:hypothetical protein
MGLFSRKKKEEKKEEPVPAPPQTENNNTEPQNTNDPQQQQQQNIDPNNTQTLNPDQIPDKYNPEVEKEVQNELDSLFDKNTKSSKKGNKNQNKSQDDNQNNQIEAEQYPSNENVDPEVLSNKLSNNLNNEDEKKPILKKKKPPPRRTIAYDPEPSVDFTNFDTDQLPPPPVADQRTTNAPRRVPNYPINQNYNNQSPNYQYVTIRTDLLTDRAGQPLQTRRKKKVQVKQRLIIPPTFLQQQVHLMPANHIQVKKNNQSSFAKNPTHSYSEQFYSSIVPAENGMMRMANAPPPQQQMKKFPRPLIMADEMDDVVAPTRRRPNNKRQLGNGGAAGLPPLVIPANNKTPIVPYGYFNLLEIFMIFF